MSETKTVALFTTCMVDQIMPEVGVATVHLLRRLGYEVAFPEAQTCCGQPFYNSGFQKETANLARRTIEILEPYEAVVLPGGSCTTMIRLEYAHLLADEPDWLRRANELAAKTFELSQFLAREGVELSGDATPSASSGQAATGQPITYHDSCHMCRMLGLKEEPREALTAVGYTITEMAESDRCCGFGGLFSIRMPEVSNAMTADKLRQAEATGAHTIVTADPGCLMQMRGLAEGVEVKHLAVALEEVTR